MLFPIGFAIPESKIIDKIPEKKYLLSSLVPGIQATYTFESEEDYREEYKKSLFALTCRKVGWDCLRHYEILACGAIPLFLDLPQVPCTTMIQYPKELVLEANSHLLPLLHTASFSELVEKAQPHLERLLAYTKEHLTTKVLAKYVIQAIFKETKTVLFLSNEYEVDYQRCLLLHGLKELLGTKCEEWPSVEHLYTNFPEELVHNLYGKGFHVARTLSDSYQTPLTPEEVLQGIQAKKWDIILYGSVHRGLPFLEEVTTTYPPERVAFVCGEDQHECEYMKPLVKKGHPFFIREH
jgi:hypothetical protein